jgi:broad specificity phosphatase PhoE
MQPADTPLSPRGLRQAEAAAQRLAALKPVALLSSDLPRARQTAEAVAAATGLPIAFEPLLQERNFGALRGRPHDSLGFDPMSMTEAPPEGESLAAFWERVEQAWAAVAARRAALGGPLVVVSHGLVIHAALQRHARWPDTLALPARLANTSVSIVEAGPEPWVRLVDCTAHLAGGVADDAQALSGG